MNLPPTRSTDLTEREEYAIHEAGHASMLILLRRPILFATIQPRRCAGEVCRNPKSILPWSPQFRALVGMAGIAAQVISSEKRNPTLERELAFFRYKESATDDLKNLARLNIIEGPREKALLETCIAKLEPVWGNLKSVAAALMREETLYHHETYLSFIGDREGLERYGRTLRARSPVPPPPQWLTNVMPGCTPGPWFAPLSRWENLRGAVGSAIRSLTRPRSP